MSFNPKIRLLYISGRTTQQSIGCNSVVEGGILYITPRGYQKLCTAAVGPDGDNATFAVLRELGVSDQNICRAERRGFGLVVDYDLVDFFVVNG